MPTTAEDFIIINTAVEVVAVSALSKAEHMRLHSASTAPFDRYSETSLVRPTHRRVILVPRP